MYAVTVLFQIDPSSVEPFMLKMRENASTSLKLEDGCARFDICQDESAPEFVFLYELYSDRAAFDAHLASDHFKNFDSHVGQMIVAKEIRTFNEVWT